MLQSIDFPYVLYSICIMGWILSNAYFQSGLLVYFGESGAIVMSLVANLASFFAFSCAYRFSCRLASALPNNRLKIWQRVLLIALNTYALLVNLIPGLTVTGVDIYNPSEFVIHFGEFNNGFFLSIVALVFLTFKNFWSLRRSALAVKKQKSNYMVAGIVIFMSSTAVVHLLITYLWQDFSYVWLPPVLSITEAALMGYALLHTRFYSWKYLSCTSLTYMMNSSIYIGLLSVLLGFQDSSYFIALLVALLVLTGVTWHWTLEKMKVISNCVFYGEKSNPVDNIYGLIEEFKLSSKNATQKLADLLNIRSNELFLVRQNASYSIFIPHLTKSSSALVKDELDYKLHYSYLESDPQLHAVQQKMSENKTALVLPLFDSDSIVSHLLIASHKKDGSLFSNEEITALQIVLNQVQVYIDSEKKILQSQALANSIAHEMRNPLAQIQYHFERIESFVTYENDIHHNLERLHEELMQGKHAVHRGAQLIDIILTESKGASINEKLFKSVSIAHVTQKALDDYGYESNEIKNRIEFDDKDDFIVHINEALYSFVLFNLLRNAIHYFQQCPESRIALKLVRGESENRLIFRDTGPGIEPHVLLNIFDEFFTYQKHGGSGLGLAYCSRVMNSFKGQISCCSKLGEFTEFHLSFPRVTQPIIGQPEGMAESTEEAVDNIILNTTRNKKRVLVVDDRKVQRLLALSYLAKDNLDIVQAENGREAVDIVKQQMIDLIFMDIQMPVMDGFEATKQIKALSPDVPVIALSGGADEHEIEAIKELMDDHLTKPVKKQELRRKLSTWLT
ncbi:hybrid sensor histidine kinase/response regulator [Vibrio sp. Of7-15]|uniref:ATP-binding response regulator n=1 Tax=Vibrio sp. Of7-15 TaxID=2724879 RepID=UPI001EF33726|nr:hybrid sensor histidine kinase/response regulator [Vibrio sp. Of7-15]